MHKQDFNYSGINYAVDSEVVTTSNLTSAQIVEVDVIVVDLSNPDEPTVSLGTLWENLEGRNVKEVIPHLTNSRKLYIDYRKKGDKSVILGNASKESVDTLDKFADSILENLPEAPEGFSGWWHL